MSRPICIVDTNVVVAGLVTRDATSPVARMLDGMLAAAFPFVLSHALLAEYRVVLLRAAVRRLHRLAAEEIDLLLTDLAHHAIVLVPGAAEAAPDAGDQFLWDLLAARSDLILVTGDKRLLQDVAMRGRVVTPHAFVAGE